MKRWIHASAELIAPWNDPELKYVCNTNGYLCYRKIVDGRGKWFAHKQNEPVETMVPITYDQARGFEPMPDEEPIRKLQRELGKMLLPPEGYVGAASKADTTNELSAELLDVFESIVGDIWAIEKSSHDCYIVMSEDRFNESEADRMVIKLNHELKRLGLSKHVSKVDYFWSGDDEHPLRIAMTLKKHVEM